MGNNVTRRRFLKSTAAGLSFAALPDFATAQLGNAAAAQARSRPRRIFGDRAGLDRGQRPADCRRSITRDHQRVRFGKLEYRSGLVLTSSFRGFGGLSGLRLDPRASASSPISDKGSWFTGRILYRGREMIGLDDVEAAPMLGPDGRPITARGWFDSEAIALDGSLVYVGARARQPDSAFRFQQGLYARARRGGAAAAGGAQAAVQQGAGSAGRWCRRACRSRAR